jgi:hypothetical protein
VTVKQRSCGDYDQRVPTSKARDGPGVGGLKSAEFACAINGSYLT